jgi:hypothetical protein
MDFPSQRIQGRGRAGCQSLEVIGQVIRGVDETRAHILVLPRFVQSEIPNLTLRL